MLNTIARLILARRVCPGVRAPQPWRAPHGCGHHITKGMRSAALPTLWPGFYSAARRSQPGY